MGVWVGDLFFVVVCFVLFCFGGCFFEVFSVCLFCFGAVVGGGGG